MRQPLRCYTLYALICGVAATPVWAAQPLSLDDAVNLAMRRNVAARLAQHDVQRARAAVQTARAALLPSLGLQAAYIRLDNDRLVSGRVALADNQVLGNVNLTLPLVQPVAWGTLTEEHGAHRVAQQSLRETRRQVGIAAAQTYLAVVTQWRLLDAAKHARDTARAHFEFAGERFGGGVGNRLDVLRADEEYAGSEALVQRTWLALKQVQEALGVLIDADAPYDIELVWNLLPPLPLPEQAQREAERGRANLAQRRAELTLTQLRLDHFSRRFWPTLTLTGGPFYQQPPTLTVPRHGYQAQINLSLPLFDGGLRYAERHANQAAVAQARSRLEYGLQQARSELRVAFAAVERAHRALTASQRGEQSAALAIELTQEAYKRGSTDNLEVIDAERRGRDAATAAIGAEDALHRAHLDVLIAAGIFPVL